VDAWAHWDQATAWYGDALVDVWAGRPLPQVAYGDVLVASARGIGAGAILYLNTSERLQRWSVRPLARAFVCLRSF